MILGAFCHCLWATNILVSIHDWTLPHGWESGPTRSYHMAGCSGWGWGGGGGHEGREEMATRGEGNMGGGKKWLPACCDLTTGTEL